MYKQSVIKPEVSVIIPCYNYGIYLQDTVESLLAQTFHALEIIIVDDGSTDPFTREKLQSFIHPSIKVIHSDNRGPGSARNIGFEHSQGDFLLLCDADDLFHPDFVTRAITLLKIYPQLGAVSSWTTCFGDEDYVWFPMGGGLNNFLYSTTCPVSGLVRRQAWIESGGFDIQYDVGYEDWDFWIRVTKKNWLIHIIQETLFYYRQKKESRVKDTFRQHDVIYRKIMKNHPDVFTANPEI